MKIVDAFIFGLEYELDLLDLRFEYLYPFVDFFVLVEAPFTHQGNPKPLFYHDNKSRFEKFNDKIIHIIVDKPFRKPEANLNQAFWPNEILHRNEIITGLNQIDSLSENDIIVLSDSDEFPSIESIQYFIDNGLSSMHCMMQDMYYYYMNMKADYPWCGSQITVFKEYQQFSPQDVRGKRWNSPKLPTHGGWHFSYMGGKQAIIQKITSVSEAHRHTSFVDSDSLNTYIDSDILHFNNHKLSKIDMRSVPLPRIILEKQSELLTKGLLKV